MTAQPFALTETPASRQDRLRLLWPVCFVILFAWFSWRIGGDGSPDFRAYHLYNGYAVATGGRPGDIAAAQLQTYFFPGLDWGYYWVFRALDAHPALLRVLLGLPYAAAAWAVFAIGRAALPKGWPARAPLAAALALFGVTGAAGFATIGTTMSDIVPGLPVLAAASLWLAARGAPAASLGRRRLSALAAGALSGVATGLKLTCVPLFAGMLIAVFVGELPRWRQAAAFALLFLAAGLTVTFAIAGWWWAHNYATLGNPVFPAFNDVFRSDLVDHGRWSDDRFKPRTWKMALFYPAYWAFRPSRWAIELPMRDPRMLIGLGSALALLLAFARPLRSRSRGRAAIAAGFAAVFFLASYVLWEIQFSIYRYLAVLECLSGVLAAAALAAWVPRRMAIPATTGLVAAGIVAAIATRYPWWDRSLPSPRVLEVAAPAIPPDSMVIFLDPYAMAYTVPFLPASVRVIGANTNLVHPGDAGLLQQRIEAAIRAHQGPLWGMEDAVAGDYPGAAEQTLAYYGLRRAGDCVLIRTNIETPRITACPLGRAP